MRRSRLQIGELERLARFAMVAAECGLQMFNGGPKRCARLVRIALRLKSAPERGVGPARIATKRSRLLFQHFQGSPGVLCRLLWATKLQFHLGTRNEKALQHIRAFSALL